MDNAMQPPIPPSAQAPFEQIQATMHSVVRRQWWLWSSGVLVTLLLTLGIASFAFPGLLSEQKEFYTFNLNLAVRGLVGLVLLFNVYTIYQQLQIQRIQFALEQQIGAFDRLGDRTEQVYKIAALDCVTGLYNRQSGEHRLAEEISRSQRHSRPLTILMLDLNGLKQINDTFGHPAGDLMLRYFSERLQSAIRGSDVPIRIGGDEFLVLLPECKVSEVQLVLNRLDGIIGEFDGHKIPLGFAVGWTDYIPGESSQTLMMRADTALYANKRVVTEKKEERAENESFHPGPSSGGKSPSNNAASTLTPRELQVLQLLAQGQSNKEVAGALHISVRTVETYRAKIMSQLNVHSATELVLYAVRNKIIKVNEIS
ncbi:MAG: diguanylate cyclase [Candidatus Acidiferrum sp.]